MLNFINGNRLADIADFKIDFDHKELNPNIFRKNSIIFCKTDFLDILFNYIGLSGRKYILISHMSDHPINSIRFNKKPPSIVKWYAQNALFNSEELHPIPLGLENHTGRSKGSFTDHQWFEDNNQELSNNEKEFKLYCNWNVNTNQEVRVPMMDHIKASGLPYTFENKLSFYNYCTNMSKHKFVICPPGNGADTHRVWESLYLGCIPIVKKSRIYPYDLPIIQINDWSEVTQELLESYIYEGDKSQLFLKYWETLIKEDLIKLNVKQ